jgi:ribosomal protein S27AE
MAKPKCPKCDHALFQSSEISPINKHFKLLAVHCARCGSVVDVTDWDDVGSLVHGFANALGVAI